MKSAIEAAHEAYRAFQEHERRTPVQLSLLTNPPRDDRVSDMATTEKEIIDQAEEHFGPINPGGLLNALEAFHMAGADDENAGNVESPTGHFYRVDRWIVVTDSQGFRDVHTYDSKDEAENEFVQLLDAYAEWHGADRHFLHGYVEG